MRTLIPFLLALAIAFQWMAGHLYFRIAYSTELKHQMDEREAQVASRLKEKIGFEIRLRKLEEAEFDPRFIGYGNHFFFSEEIDGREVLFSITDPVRTVEYEHLLGHGPEDVPEKQALLERLFSKFTVSTLLIRLRKQAPTFVFRTFLTNRLCGLFPADVLTPPPQFAVSSLQ